MKKTMLLFACLLPVCAWAQAGKAAKHLLPALKQNPVKTAEFTAFNMKISLPSSVLKNHGADLIRTHLNRKLDPVLYKQLAARNDKRILQSLQRFVQNRKEFLKHKNQIVASRRLRAVKGKISYESYLPKELDTLYIGEWHSIPGIAEEVASLISQLPAIYPGRRIYLATEFLAVDEEANEFIHNLITVPEMLLFPLPSKEKVFYTALAEGIPLFPLENIDAFADYFYKELGFFPAGKTGFQFAASFEGVRLRNKMWADLLRNLRQRDPEALIVVYAGFGHVGYNIESSLPYLLGGSSFVVSFTQPQNLAYDNPFARYFALPAKLLKQLNTVPDTKLVESWKTPAYKKLLGADMTVIMPAQK